MLQGDQEFSLDRALETHHHQFPHGKSLIHLVPSAGHKPPTGEVFPAAKRPSLDHVVSSEVVEADLPNPMLQLPEDLSLMEKWLWLTKEDPDFVAADIAVNGFQIFWKDPNVTPPLMYVGDAIHSPSIPRTSRNQEERLSLIVDEWEERAIVTKDLQKIPTHAHFSRLFGVVKDKTELRPVIDLSLLNRYLICPDLKMETLEKLLDLVQDPMWAAIIDVQDAFLSVKIAVQFQKFFCFILKKKAYMFLRMPFGLSPAPWIFSRLMKTIKKFLRIKMVNINSFIDDFIVWARSYPLAVIHMNWTKQLLTWLGLTVNVKKSSVAPQQLIQYLGVILDLRHLTLQLPQSKVEKLLSLTKSVSSHTLVSRRTLESLVGLIMFSHSILPLGRMHANPLIMWLNKHTSATARDALVGIDASLLQLLSPFLNRKWLQSKASFKKLTPDLVLMSDASDFGWSGVVMPYCIRDSWWQQEQQESINWREMAAILYSVAFLKTKIQGRSLMIHTDNLVTFFCLKKMGSIRCPLMNSLVRDFLSLCWKEKITFQVRHIKGSNNVLADAGSRDNLDAAHNCLDQATLEFCFRRCGYVPLTDLFGSMENTRCKFYISPCPDNSPNCLGVDALSVDWNKFDRVYMFPPPLLLPKLISKIMSYRGRGVLIAPYTNNSFLGALESRATRRTRLPETYFLFQMKNGSMVTRPKFWDLWMWELDPLV